MTQRERERGGGGGGGVGEIHVIKHREVEEQETQESSLLTHVTAVA